MLAHTQHTSLGGISSKHAIWAYHLLQLILSLREVYLHEMLDGRGQHLWKKEENLHIVVF